MNFRVKLIYIIALLLIICLSGCDYTTVAKNDEYSVIIRDEQYHIRFHAHTVPPELPYCASMLESKAEFTSTEEMKQAILTGNIPSRYYSQMRYTYQGEREIPICDLDISHDFTLPSGWKKSNVRWFTAYYAYEITDGIHNGLLSDFQADNELFTEIFERDLAWYDNQENIRIRSVAERSATVYELIDRDMVYYEIDTKNKNITVMEYYEHPGYIDGFNAIPNGIEIYIKEGNKYYYVRLNQLSSRPTIEWLQSFGLKDSVAE